MGTNLDKSEHEARIGGGGGDGRPCGSGDLGRPAGRASRGRSGRSGGSGGSRDLADLVVLTPPGERVALAGLWAERAAALVWVRHFG